MVMLTQDQYEALNKEDKYTYEDDRLDQDARLQVVATSTVRHTVTCGRRLVLPDRTHHGRVGHRHTPSVGASSIASP